MQPVRLCVHPKCYQAAIMTSRDTSRCREHYRSDVLANVELVRCEVIPSEGRRGELAGVTDAVTNETVRQGLVYLDPLETNVAALVYGGIVKVLVDAAAAEPAEAAAVEG